MRSKHLLILGIILFTVFCFFGGCDKSNTQPAGTQDTLEIPEIPINILDLRAEPDIVLVNENTTLTCETSHNDDLNFTWSSAAGAFFAGNSGNSVLWRA